MDEHEVAGVVERKPTTGGWIGVVILGLIVGYGFTLFSDAWTTDMQFFVIGLITSLVAIVIFAVVYVASVEQDNKKARDERIAEASTRYLQDRGGKSKASD